MADNFNFELVSPERLLLSQKVSEVVIPASDGEMTVLANHAPTMTTIKPGVVTVKADGKTDRYVVFGGFADILPTGCTLLAESAVHVDELDKSQLDRRIAAARDELDGHGDDDRKTSLERLIGELTSLKETLIPA